MGVSVDGSSFLFGDDASPESVTGVAGPVLLAATVPDLARGDVLAGRYQIEAAIGSGGSGRVLRAFDRVTRSPVALKILRSEFANDPVWTERFSRELRVGRQIQHPNVCRIYDIGEADGHRFLSMELATGGTLRSQMEPGAMPRSVDDRIADARAIIQGVAALHSAGIVHRDLKPENILRTADGRLLVSDFGLATDPGAGPATTVMIGTPRYMAPEVVMGDPATARSDVWALGVVMHEILSGERPNRSVIKRRRRMYTPPEVGSLRERRLVELCARCSEEDPAERPASAVELRREFEAAAAGRRFGNRALKKQLAWGAVALVTIGSLGLVRNRWTSNAEASSSQVTSSRSAEILRPFGEPQDWSKDSTRLAVLPGVAHCLSRNHAANEVTLIWGKPRNAEDIHLGTGQRRNSRLLPHTYAKGCPQVSPDGGSLLFEQMVDGASQIFVSHSPRGENPQMLVRGSMPIWLPNGQEFSFLVDARHAGVFAIPTREMTVVSDSVREPYSIAGHAVEPSGERMAVLYTTDSFGSLIVLHALPSLETLHSAPVPEWARDLTFSTTGDVQFTVLGAAGSREIVSMQADSTGVKRVAQVPGLDIQFALEVDTNRVVVSGTRQFNLWSRTEEGALKQLTADGQSVNGALSTSRMLAIQRRLPDSREVIVLRREDGREEQLTSGTSDLTPTFAPDGKSVVFSKFREGELVDCDVDSQRCSTIHTEKLLPAYPAIDPSDKWIAYVTAIGASRVRLIPRHGGREPRDLGPVQACGPVWSTSNLLWAVASVSSSDKVWAEIDVNAGKRTGETRLVRTRDGEDCRPPVATTQSVIPLVSDTSYVYSRPATATASL